MASRWRGASRSPWKHAPRSTTIDVPCAPAAAPMPRRFPSCSSRWSYSSVPVAARAKMRTMQLEGRARAAQAPRAGEPRAVAAQRLEELRAAEVRRVEEPRAGEGWWSLGDRRRLARVGSLLARPAARRPVEPSLGAEPVEERPRVGVRGRPAVGSCRAPADNPREAVRQRAEPSLERELAGERGLEALVPEAMIWARGGQSRAPRPWS